MSVKSSKRNADWHPEDVKAAIRKTGVSLSAFAVQHGKSISAIRMTLHRQSAAVQSLIAEHLNLPPQTIWPSRYDEMGNPIDRRRSAPRIITRRYRSARSQKSRTE